MKKSEVYLVNPPAFQTSSVECDIIYPRKLFLFMQILINLTRATDT